MPSHQERVRRNYDEPQPLALRVLRRFAEGQTVAEIANSVQTTPTIVRKLIEMRQNHMQ